MELNFNGASKTLTILALTGVLSLSGSLITRLSAQAIPLGNTPAEMGLKQNNVGRLPARIAIVLRQDLAKQTGQPVGKFKVVSASRQTWSDGCLGLGRPEEGCLAALVPGWRVTLTDGKQTWIYRTDNTGRSFRRETSNGGTSQTNLPGNVSQALLAQASNQLLLSPGDLKIVKADRQTWPNGCLGIIEPNVRCTQAVVEGWRVVVKNGDRQWVYRTDSTGANIKLDAMASLPQNVQQAVLRRAYEQSAATPGQLKITYASLQTWDGCMGLAEPNQACTMIAMRGWKVAVSGKNSVWMYHTDDTGSTIRWNQAESEGVTVGLKPVIMPADQLPSALPSTAIFRAISSGGFTGRYSETILYEDGRILRFVSPNSAPQELRRLSRQNLRQFQQLLARQQFNQFHRQNYTAPQGAADYFSVMLSSPNTTVGYADIVQNDLPQPLQAVIQAWNGMIQ